MICGVGIDTVEIARFDMWIDNPRKIARFFNGIEIVYIDRLPRAQRASSLATRFAAKEAFGKAVGSGLRSVRLTDIAVSNGSDGAPRLRLFDSARRLVDHIAQHRLHLSLSHTRRYATACVIIEERHE